MPNSATDLCSWWLGRNNQTNELASSLFIFFIVVFAFSWYFLTLKKEKVPLPPGPRGLPLVGNLPFLSPELHTYFAKLAHTYGPIYKLQLGSKLGIVVSSSSLAKEVLKDHDITFANRDVPAAAGVIAYGGKDIVWTPYSPEWRMLRKVCVREMLGSSSLDALHSLRHREIRRMVGDVYANNGSPINVGQELFLTMLNVITSMLWGGSIKGEEGTSIGAEFREIVGEITELLGKPNISDFYPGLARFDLQSIRKKMTVLFRRFDGIFESIVQKRQKMDGKESKESKDFLQILLQLIDKEDAKTPFTMTHLKALLMDMVVGGTDTTSNSVELAITELMNKPEIMNKAHDELDRVVGKDNIVEECHLPKLHYLQSVMKEVLRLHPALPLLVPHCPSSSCTIGGYMVPKGARVFIHVWAIHRDPLIWENPLEFDPDRFYMGRADYSGNDFNYLPFGSGRRICAGIPMAERMFMYELASLLHSFNWSLPEGATLDMKEKFGIVLKKAHPLIAIPTPRLSNPALYA